MANTNEALLAALQARKADPETMASVKDGKWTPGTFSLLTTEQIGEAMGLRVGQVLLLVKTSEGLMPMTKAPSPQGDKPLQTTPVEASSSSPHVSSLGAGWKKLTEEIWVSDGRTGQVTEVCTDATSKWRGSITDTEDIIHEVFSGTNLVMGQQVTFSRIRYTNGKRWYARQITARE